MLKVTRDKNIRELWNRLTVHINMTISSDVGKRWNGIANDPSEWSQKFLGWIVGHVRSNWCFSSHGMSQKVWGNEVGLVDYISSARVIGNSGWWSQRQVKNIWVVTGKNFQFNTKEKMVNRARLVVSAGDTITMKEEMEGEQTVRLWMWSRKAEHDIPCL